jgi:hypothetical protein
MIGRPGPEVAFFKADMRLYQELNRYIPASCFATRSVTGNTRTNGKRSAFRTPKQDREATLLASGMSVKNSAAKVDAGRRTVYDWLEQDGLARELL